MILQAGGQDRYIVETTSGAGTTAREGSTKTDAILVTLFVDSVTSGNLNVRVVTLTDSGKEVETISFPTISATTTNLLLKKSGVTMQRFRVEATYTGVCSYEVYVRAIVGAGESSVRIIGASVFETESIEITSTPSVLIPSALEDRNGVSILNYAGTGILYVSESLAKLPARAWPVPEGGGWSLDVASGVTIYAMSDDQDLDVRVVQAGG